MKIIAFAGSNSLHSINKKLLMFASSYFAEEEVEILDLNDYPLPVFGVDIEKELGHPEEAVKFAARIDSADLLLISLAEHNGAYATAFKNIFDWISRIKGRKAFGDKPVFLMAASDGARGARNVLEIANNRMPFSGGKVLETFSFPKFYENFDESNGISNPELRQLLEVKIVSVKTKLKEAH